ncbi:hypothetical protein [Dyadobacter sp. CY326]|uniref:hypothetical protein n=1 Tax=Dyadobacter sp. CY326 TaxID=2907300 RepID=UPI001F203C78|nr:hypothetical protein [Dyadobacter sp. CY326]MCE7064014.1 hypothetical protein [Dyadobacter sp. CY326]
MVSTFNSSYGKIEPQKLAEEVFQSRQRTSSRGGILKAEAVQLWLKILGNHSIDTFQDLDLRFQSLTMDRNNESSVNWFGLLERDNAGIPGQRSGISLGYFLMLAGRDNLVKPDRMIMRFLRHHFSYETIQVKHAIILIASLVTILKNQYGHQDLTIRELDHAIWKYQRTLTDQ